MSFQDRALMSFVYVAGGRSFARQNSLTLWPLFSNSANHPERSAGVQLTLVLGFVAAAEAAAVTAFIIRQVLLVENLGFHLSRGRQSGYPVVAATLHHPVPNKLGRIDPSHCGGPSMLMSKIPRMLI